ncbi:Uncharacterised protein [Mycoplasmopsis arginini]|nr:Uncharacterised protein [Mycoplasmopsis arginini]
MNLNNFRFLFIVFLIASILSFFIFIAIFILKEFSINAFFTKEKCFKNFFVLNFIHPKYSTYIYFKLYNVK